MKNPIYYTIILFVLLFTGCAKPPDPAQPAKYIDAKKYYPLKIGNWWKYEEKTTENDGSINSRNVIVKIDSINNGYYRFNKTDTNNNLLAYWYVYDKQSEIRFISGRTLFSTDFINKSDTLVSHITYADTLKEDKKITDRIYESLHKTYTTFGIFETIKREFRNESITFQYKLTLKQNDYFCKDIGTVYRVETEVKKRTLNTETIKVESFLKDYHLEK